MVRRAFGLVALEVAPVVATVLTGLHPGFVLDRTRPRGTHGTTPLPRLDVGHTTSVPLGEGK